MWPFFYPSERILPPKAPPYPPVPIEEIRRAFDVLNWVMAEPWIVEDDWRTLSRARDILASRVLRHPVEITPSGGESARASSGAS